MKYGALDSIPRQTTIGGQPHMLAYINPEEEGMIQNYRGNMPPVAGPDGVPAYFFHSSWGGSKSTSSTSSNNDKDDKPGFFESIGNSISSVATAVTNTFSGGGSDGVGNFGTVGDILGSIGDDLGITDYGTNDPKPTTTGTKGGNTTAAKVFYDTGGGSHSTQAAADAASAALAPKFYDAFGNAYATRAEAINADEVAELSGTLANTAVMGPYDEGGYFDAMGNEYGSAAAAAAADIEASALSKAASGSQEVSDYIDKFGMTGLEDRFLVGRINPATGKPYEARDTNIVNPLDADTIPFAGSQNTYTDDEIQYFGGDPYSSTVDGVSLNDPFDDPRTEVVETEEDYNGTAPVDEDIVGVPMDIETDSGPSYRDVYASQDIYGDFYGGESGGLWDRFSNSYFTRFGYSPEQFNEMIRKVENPDGTTSFFGAEGALIDPESIGSNYRLAGEPTSLKIGEEQVKVGTQTIDAAGNLIDTNYIDGYNASNYNVS